MPSSVPRGRAPADPPTIDLSECIEQCWSALERQRISFEHERASFAEQRRLWDTQKTIMGARIAELERQVSTMSQAGASTPPSKEPEETRKSRSQSVPVWLGSRPAGPPTRVFPKENEYVCVPGHEVRYDQNWIRALDRALNPSDYPDKVEPMGIPIELVHNELDGITLKSTALPAGLVAKLSPLLKSRRTSPNKKTNVENGNDEPSQEPNQQGQDRDDTDKAPQRPNIDLSLVNGDDAGYKLTEITTSSSDDSNYSLMSDKSNDEVQLAPQHTLEQTKNAEDSLPQIDEDPALEGPLSLKNDPAFDKEFLEKLDLKLRKEAQRPRLGSGSSIFSVIDDGLDGLDGIRFRTDTTNFGTRYGCTSVRDIPR